MHKRANAVPILDDSGMLCYWQELGRRVVTRVAALSQGTRYPTDVN